MSVVSLTVTVGLAGAGGGGLTARSISGTLFSSSGTPTSLLRLTVVQDVGACCRRAVLDARPADADVDAALTLTSTSLDNDDASCCSVLSGTDGRLLGGDGTLGGGRRGVRLGRDWVNADR